LLDWLMKRLSCSMCAGTSGCGYVVTTLNLTAWCLAFERLDGEGNDTRQCRFATSATTSSCARSSSSWLSLLCDSLSSFTTLAPRPPNCTTVVCQTAKLARTASLNSRLCFRVRSGISAECSTSAEPTLATAIAPGTAQRRKSTRRRARRDLRGDEGEDTHAHTHGCKATEDYVCAGHRKRRRRGFTALCTKHQGRNTSHHQLAPLLG
jgi:hypothetical protein